MQDANPTKLSLKIQMYLITDGAGRPKVIIFRLGPPWEFPYTADVTNCKQCGAWVSSRFFIQCTWRFVVHFLFHCILLFWSLLVVWNNKKSKMEDLNGHRLEFTSNSRVMCRHQFILLTTNATICRVLSTLKVSLSVSFKVAGTSFEHLYFYGSLIPLFISWYNKKW